MIAKCHKTQIANENLFYQLPIFLRCFNHMGNYFESLEIKYHEAHYPCKLQDHIIKKYDVKTKLAPKLVLSS